jgi:hypothetical protein
MREMEGVLTRAETIEGVRELEARLANGAKCRLQLPPQLLEWEAGQRLACGSDAPPPDAACVLQGRVVRVEADELLASNGGLLMRVPRAHWPALGAGDEVRAWLAPRAEPARKRTRTRGSDVAARRGTSSPVA